MQALSKRKITNNILISIFAQIVSLGTSFILNLIVPKCIPAIEYSMWQVYVLYASFVGVCHFGLMDGFLLKYSQYDYDTLDKSEAHSHFNFLLLILSLSTLSWGLIVGLTNSFSTSLMFLIGTAIIVKNLCTFGLYVFQSTNRIGKYAQVIIGQRTVYALIILGLLFSKEYNYIYYCVADLIADTVGFVFSVIYNKGIFIGKFKPVKLHAAIIKNSIIVGAIIMIANFSSNLIVGSCKMVIEWTESKLTFGQIAFAFSMTNLALTFVIAISIVFFPSLKRINESHLRPIYESMRMILSELMYIMMIFYYPCAYMLGKWLPNYAESLKYLVYLFPIIIYSTKIVLLTNNYFKIYRMESKLLYINFLSVFLEIAGLSVAYQFKHIWLLLIWTLFVTYLRSAVSEYYVCKRIGLSSIKLNIADGIVGVVFIISSLIFNTSSAIIILSVCLGLITYTNYRNLKASLKFFSKAK